VTDRLVEDVLRAADGDEVAFARVCRDRRVVTLMAGISGKFFAPGHERQDFAQEARIALLVAVRAWNAERGVDGFLGFASMVVKRRLQSALKLALAGKHGPLAEALDLDSPAGGLEVGTLADLVAGGVDPLAVVIAREKVAGVVGAVGRMSELERRAIAMLLSGESYAGDKTIDNAMQRARRKLRAAVA
jgi:hypothetical protein